MSSYPLAVHIAGRRVLFLGWNQDAAARAEDFRSRGARIIVVDSKVHAETRGVDVWFAREPQPFDFNGMILALQVERDHQAALTYRAWARAAGVLFCALDDAAASDFSHMARVSRGLLELALSSDGAAPGLLRALKNELDRELGPELADFVESVADRRVELAGLSMPERRRAMQELLAGFRLKVGVEYPAWFVHQRK